MKIRRAEHHLKGTGTHLELAMSSLISYVASRRNRLKFQEVVAERELEVQLGQGREPAFTPIVVNGSGAHPRHHFRGVEASR
jgi:hypothetical protein